MRLRRWRQAARGRRNKAKPSSRSSSAMRLLADRWEMPSAFAAPVTVPVVMISRKHPGWRKFIASQALAMHRKILR